MPKIIQILQGNAGLTGLGDDGIVYTASDEREWVEWIKPLPKTVRKREPKFKKPSLQEVYEYMIEQTQNYPIAQDESEKFHNYWESVGWKRNKTTMKDWKASVRTWLSNAKSSNQKMPALSHQQQKRQAISQQVMAVGDTNW
jgi:hypothetical protein